VLCFLFVVEKIRGASAAARHRQLRLVVVVVGIQRASL
jgi:hypothetical protein